MKLSIVIINYNTAHFINQTINAVYKSSLNLNYEIIVVDNNSTDDSVELLKKTFSDIRLVENSKNYGFAKAVNIAVDYSKGDHILLLNPDTIIEEKTIQNLYYMYSISIK